MRASFLAAGALAVSLLVVSCASEGDRSLGPGSLLQTPEHVDRESTRFDDTLPVPIIDSSSDCGRLNAGPPLEFLVSASDAETPVGRLQYSVELRPSGTGGSCSPIPFGDWEFFPDDGSYVLVTFEHVDPSCTFWIFTLRVRDTAHNESSASCQLFWVRGAD
jgi:hypothetical protein